MPSHCVKNKNDGRRIVYKDCRDKTDNKVLRAIFIFNLAEFISLHVQFLLGARDFVEDNASMSTMH